MKKLLLYFILAASVRAVSLTTNVPYLSSEPGARAATITITVTSSGGGAPRYGTYADGVSYWVAPAVGGDTGVTVTGLSATSGGISQPAGMISMVKDPITEKRGTLNNFKSYGNFDATKALQGSLPYTVTPPSGSCTSLVIALQRNVAESPGGGTSSTTGETTEAYMFVTILPDAPINSGADSIRPNITGTTKEFLRWQDFDLTRLGSFASLPAKDLTFRNEVRDIWTHSTEIFCFDVWDGANVVGYSEGGRAFRADVVHDEYATNMAGRMMGDILSLMTPNNTLAEKQPGLAAILAWANDVYHCRYDYGSDFPKVWSSGAGQHSGKYAPVLLLAALQIDQTKAGVLKMIPVTNQGADVKLRGPQEVRQLRRGVTGVVLWGDSFPYEYSGTTSLGGGSMPLRYWSELVGSNLYRGAVKTPQNSAIGQKTAGDPYGYIDGPPVPGSNYMSVNAEGNRAFAKIMLAMPAIRSIVNTDAPIEYADRLVRHGVWAAPDPVAPPPPSWVDDPWNGFPGANDFGVSYGPTAADVRFAIEGGGGLRFTSDGASMSLSADSFWDELIAAYSGDKFETNLVAVGGTSKPDIYVVGTTCYITHPHFLSTVHYTTDGSPPTGSSPVYSAPFTVPAEGTVKAFAVVSGKTDSAIRSLTYGGALPPPSYEFSKIRARKGPILPRFKS